MTDSSKKLQTGILVSIAFALMIASILFFGGDKAFLKHYSKYFVKFNSTQGLSAGSVVSLSGVEVGNIKEIHFDNEGHLVATLNVDSAFTNMLKSDSIASIKTQGALGDKYIYIITGPSSGTPLSENSYIPTDTQPDLFDMISGKAQDLGVFVQTLKEINQLIHNLNADGKSGLLVENILNTSQNINNVMSDPNVKGSFLHLKNILQKVDSGDGTLGQLVNDATLHDRLLGLLGDAPRNRYLKPLLRDAIKQNESQRQH
jgi:phospholipid/cholesterol/gamma-HCH transport system substrate-binding protein